MTYVTWIAIKPDSICPVRLEVERAIVLRDKNSQTIFMKFAKKV